MKAFIRLAVLVTALAAVCHAHSLAIKHEHEHEHENEHEHEHHVVKQTENLKKCSNGVPDECHKVRIHANRTCSCMLCQPGFVPNYNGLKCERSKDQVYDHAHGESSSEELGKYHHSHYRHKCPEQCDGQDSVQG